MNRILFEKNEIREGVATFGGVRAQHVMEVLHGEEGQILKTGEINGAIGTGVILKTGSEVTVRVSHCETAPEPWVDVILAPPRPRVLKRLLPQLAALGVGRIMLVGAEKVEKDFWGATLLKEENYRPLFVEGLMQCGTTRLPMLEAWKSFRRFVREELPRLSHARRIVAHPYLDAPPVPLPPADAQDRLLLAIGPEGGWTDLEVESLENAGFVRYSLGSRILRTDTATVALLARFMS